MDAKRNMMMPLSMVAPGREVTVCDVFGGRGLRQRLSEMGLVPGTPVTVMHGSLRGPFVVSVKGGRIMLGRGMAQRIMVI